VRDFDSLFGRRVLLELLLRLFSAPSFLFSPVGAPRPSAVISSSFHLCFVLILSSGGVSLLLCGGFIAGFFFPSLIISFLIFSGLIPVSCLLIFAITGFWKIPAALFHVLDRLPINFGASMRGADPVPCHFCSLNSSTTTIVSFSSAG
jgi:hypothetical protein